MLQEDMSQYFLRLTKLEAVITNLVPFPLHGITTYLIWFSSTSRYGSRTSLRQEWIREQN